LLDESTGMLELAAARVPPGRVERVVVGDLLTDLPTEQFDLVVSALAVHHLDGGQKRSLFAALWSRLPPAGRFVLADVIVPLDPPGVVAPPPPGHARSRPATTDRTASTIRSRGWPGSASR